MITQERGFGLYGVKNGKEIKLAMQSLWLTGQVHSFGARLLVSHVLKSSETEPIEAIYSFMLPRDATLRRFYITGKGFSVHSELRPTQEAEKEYERGIEAGHLSAFSKIYGDGIVNLNVGNIRPDEEITVHLEILAGVESHHNGMRFRFPFTLAPSYHAQAKMVQCGDGQGEIELPEDKFGDVILPTFMKDSDNLHKIGFDLNVHFPQESIQVASPSHNITTNHIKESVTKVSLSVEGDIPNRDLVLDAHANEPIIQINQGQDSTGNTSFICTIPSNEFGETTQKERNFVFLLDRSGSMQGKPMEQAKNALRACISALSEDDRFSLVAFDNDVEIFDSLVNGTMKNRERLEKFLDGIHARGGTELMHGIKTASTILGDTQGDIMVITDGQVFGGEDIMQHAKALSLRLHILGIGAASQDRFISSLARETGGISKFVTPRERIDLVALELFSGIGRPVATEVKVDLKGVDDGRIEPAVPCSIYEGSSIQVYGHYQGQNSPSLSIKWEQNGNKQEREYSLGIDENCSGNTLRLLRGARLITDYENAMDSSSSRRSVDRRQNRRAKDRLESLSKEHGLASREMALVAVVEREGDRAGKMPKTMVVPVGMPQDVDFDSYIQAPRMMATHACCDLSAPIIQDCQKSMYSMAYRSDSLMDRTVHSLEEASVSAAGVGIRLVIMIEPDGGMPGDTLDDRVLASTIVLLYLVQEENINNLRAAYKSHMKKLINFLKSSMEQCDSDKQQRMKHILDGIENGNLPSCDMTQYVSEIIKGKFRSTDNVWDEIVSVH